MSKKIIVKEYLEGDEIDLSLQSLTPSALPVKDIAFLKKGKKLDLSKNQIITLPDNFVTLMGHLVKLDLSSNGLTELPANFGDLAFLQHLDLFNNNLTTLPGGFYRLSMLKWLDLKENSPLAHPSGEVVGLCRNDAECRACATKVVEYMRKENADQEKKKQKALEQKRAKKEALKRELERLEELEKLEKKRAKLEEKSREKARRRAEFEERVREEGRSSVVEEPQKREAEEAELPSAPLPLALLKTAVILAAVLLLFTVVVVAGVLQPEGGLSAMTSEPLSRITETLHSGLTSVNSYLVTVSPNKTLYLDLQKSLVSFSSLLSEMMVICKDTTFMIYKLGNEQLSELRTFIQKSVM